MEQDADVERVGFIGLGNQGAPIAQRIAGAGWPLTVWARRPEAAVAFAHTATRSETVEELAGAVDLLCLCVVDDAGVQEIAERALPSMAPGGLVAILSTVRPQTCVELAALAGARRIAVIDAPVSGGGKAAADGTLTVMMGGSKSECARARTVFDSFGGLIVRLGDVGAGQRAKLVNNALLTAIMGLTQEARETGSALGLARDALDEVLAVSSGGSFGHGILRALPDLSAFANGAALLEKDVGLLRDLAASQAIAAPELLDVADAFLARCTAPHS